MASAVCALAVDIEGNKDYKSELTTLIADLKTAGRKANPHFQLSFDTGIYPKNEAEGYDHTGLAKALDFFVPM